MKQAFRLKRIGSDRLATIEKANEIIEDYQSQGYRLTLRQLYYQFVSKDLIPNSERSYKNLGNIISDGRLAGMIDWDAIEDRVRKPVMSSEWPDVASLVESALAAYRLQRWHGQENYVELWVEKDALAGVLEPISREFHVTMMVNRGYSSQSAMKESGERFKEAIDRGKNPILIYLGDMDPSGEDMVRDVRDRLAMFEAEVDVTKLALTMEQVEEYDPPPNPAKVSDSRASAYIAQHGDSSWEVDALPPNVLAGLIRRELRKYVDQEMMDVIIERENQDKKDLTKAVASIMKKRK